MNFIEELKWRGLIQDITPTFEDEINEKMKVGYIGFDPTSDSLHIGSLVQLIILKHFQNYGHKPIVLIGGATGMIGDPSGKSKERNLLSQKIIDQNIKSLHVQFSKFLNFDDLVDSLCDGKSDFGIMAIENSIAGSIIPNYALIDKNDLQIVGEYYLNIHHHLMALPNQKIEDISEVNSHPMALLQCKDYLRNLSNLKLIEDVDTAEVAQRISEKQLKGVAAIAPKVAAELYDLEIIADDIQTIKNNATRFVIVQKRREESLVVETNKASLKFMLDHKRGSLAAVLNVMSDCKLNLTKIQSMPKIDTPWKYAFFVDITFDKLKDYQKAIAIINIMAGDFKILGEYKSGKK